MPAPMQDDMDTVLRNIREKLIAGVEKRLDADAPVGFLLSGGLDSSLVCSIAAKKCKIQQFMAYLTQKKAHKRDGKELDA